MIRIAHPAWSMVFAIAGVAIWVGSRDKPIAAERTTTSALAAVARPATAIAREEWSPRSPDAAATWALSQPVDQRITAVAAVLIAAADSPETAVRLAQKFCRDDPTFVREHGSSLIAVLAAAGEFRAAVTFAELGGPERSAWMRTAFERWARADPVAAQKAAQALDDADALAGAESVLRSPAES